MATNSANVKMGVTGVSQFKTSMNQAKQAVKTLDAQLALTEKEFKASGDAEAYMAKKSAELQAKLEAQKNVVDNAQKALDAMAKNGVDRSSASYQKLYQEMLRAKGEMLDTETAMSNISVAGDEAADGVDSMNQQLKRVGDGINIQNVTDALGKISDGMGDVIKKSWKMGEAIVQATLGAGSWADELGATATQYEDTLRLFGGGRSATDTLQRMRKTANLIDTDVDTILNAQDKLKKNKEKGDKEAMGAWAYLGIDPNGKGDVDLFWETGEAIAKLGTTEDKVSYAQKLFGKSWRELLPLFTTGRKEYEKTMNSWNVVEDEQLDNLGKMDDQYQKLQGEWETFKNELLSTFSGPLTEGMEKITGLFEALNDYLDTPEGQAMLEQMGKTITQLINDLTNVSPEDVINGLSGVVDGIRDGLEWISENSELVVGAVEAFIAAWGAVKVAEGITTVMKLISGIQGLTSGGAAAGAAAGASWGGAFASAVLKAAPWLLGLYEVLKPSEGGNDDLIGENGQLTEAAKKAGFDINGNGELITPDRKYEHTIDALTKGSAWGTTGEATDLTQTRLRNARNGLPGLDEATNKMEKAAEDLTGGSAQQKKSSSEMSQAAGTLQGMPGLVESAILHGMSQIKVYIDGSLAGGVLSPVVNNAFASAVGAFKP